MDGRCYGHEPMITQRGMAIHVGSLPHPRLHRALRLAALAGADHRLAAGLRAGPRVAALVAHVHATAEQLAACSRGGTGEAKWAPNSPACSPTVEHAPMASCMSLILASSSRINRSHSHVSPQGGTTTSQAASGSCVLPQGQALGPASLQAPHLPAWHTCRHGRTQG